MIGADMKDESEVVNTETCHTFIFNSGVVLCETAVCMGVPNKRRKE